MQIECRNYTEYKPKHLTDFESILFEVLVN